MYSAFKISETEDKAKEQYMNLKFSKIKNMFINGLTSKKVPMESRDTYWRYVYNIDNVHTIQNFDYEIYLNSKPDFNPKQAIRYICLGFLVLQLAFGMYL